MYLDSASLKPPTLGDWRASTQPVLSRFGVDGWRNFVWTGRMNLKTASLLPFLFVALQAQSEVRLPALFSDNMVLQQGKPVPVWGWADDGEVILIRFRGQQVRTTAKNLKFEAKLRPLKAGGPDTLIVSTGTQTLEFTNVLVGEVWICRGHSNMEWTLNHSYQAGAYMASATNSQIRLFLVPKNRTATPTTVIDSRWERLSSKSVQYFSAVGYYFGRDLQKARGVPVGLIGTYWGGTPAESWMDRESLEINPRYKTEILDSYEQSMKWWRAEMDKWEKEKAA